VVHIAAVYFLIYKYILIIQFLLVFVEWNVCLFAVAFQAIFSLFFFVSRGFVGKSGRWLMEKRRKKIQSSISRVLGNHKDTRANSNRVGGCLHASHPVRRLRCCISFLMHTAADEFLVVHVMQCIISCSKICFFFQLIKLLIFCFYQLLQVMLELFVAAPYLHRFFAVNTRSCRGEGVPLAEGTAMAITRLLLWYRFTVAQSTLATVATSCAVARLSSLVQLVAGGNRRTTRLAASPLHSARLMT